MQLQIDEIFAQKIIPANDSVQLLDEIIEGMDYTEFVTGIISQP